MRKQRKPISRSTFAGLLFPDLKRIFFIENMGRLSEHEADKWFLVGIATCLRETERAIQVKLEDGLTSYWLPKSQLHPEENEVKNTGDQGMLVCASWIAKEKGWLKG